MFFKIIHGFLPSSSTPEVQTSQSSVHVGRQGSLFPASCGRNSRGQELLTRWDSRFSVRPANTTFPQFWFYWKRHGLKGYHITYFNIDCSARCEWLLVSPLLCELMPFLILVSYLMLNSAVKGIFYREAVMYENAYFEADTFQIQLTRSLSRVGDPLWPFWGFWIVVSL